MNNPQVDLDSEAQSVQVTCVTCTASSMGYFAARPYFRHVVSGLLVHSRANNLTSSRRTEVGARLGKGGRGQRASARRDGDQDPAVRDDNEAVQAGGRRSARQYARHPQRPGHPRRGPYRWRSPAAALPGR